MANIRLSKALGFLSVPVLMAVAASSSFAQDTPLPRPGLFCGPDCQQSLVLNADPADVACTVGLAWNSGGHEFGAATIIISERVAKAFPNMELIITEAGGDAARDSNNIEDLIVRGADVIIVSPVDSRAISKAIGEAIAAGIAVISSDRPVVGQDVVSHIGSSNYDAGFEAGRHAVNLLGGSGKVIEIQGGLGSQPQIDRGQGFQDAIAGGDVEIIAQQTANWSRTDAVAVLEDFLQRFPNSGDVDMVFTHNGGMAEGAAVALAESGRKSDIFLVSIDGRDSELENIQAGSQDSTAMYPLTANEHILAAAKVCAGEPIPDEIVLSSQLITPENVDRFIGTRLGVPAEELGL